MIVNDCSNVIENSLQEIVEHTDNIIANYSKFFNISEVFSSDERGKIKLNRYIFNNIHTMIEDDIKAIGILLNKSLESIKENMAGLFTELDGIDFVDWKYLIFNDEICIDKFHKYIEKRQLSGEKKKNFSKELQNFLHCKNRVFNLKYFVELFDTSMLDSIINRLSNEDMINSTLIFELIDAYGLQFQKLLQFENEIKKTENSDKILTNPQNLNDILELSKKRCENYTYNNIKYKISLDYNNTMKSKDLIKANRLYIEQLIFALVEHSCLDVIKKELKKGKITKTINVDISKTKNGVSIVVVNSGFDIKDTSIFDEVGNIENKFILEAKNIAKLIHAKLDIVPIDNDGMKYTVTLS